MQIVIGADHGGYELKQYLISQLGEIGYHILDVGCSSTQSVDYPDFADQVVNELVSGNGQLGILVCGTGIGMSIAANRSNLIRAANCHNEYTAIMSREHNDANVLCLGARVLKQDEALNIAKIWLSTEFTGGRHQRRISKFSD